MSIVEHIKQGARSRWFLPLSLLLLLVTTGIITGYLYFHSLPPFALKAAFNVPSCPLTCLYNCIPGTSKCNSPPVDSKCPSSCLNGCMGDSVICVPYCKYNCTNCIPSASGGTCKGTITTTTTPVKTLTPAASCSTPCSSTMATKTCNSLPYYCPGPESNWTQGAAPKPKTAPPTNTLAPVNTVSNAPPSNTSGSNNSQGSSTPCPPKQKNNKAAQASKASKTQSQSSASNTCNDYGCSSIAQGKLWAINNCNSGDPDGDVQLCDAKGRIGTCQNKQLCCPGSGQKWTLDMTACPVTKASLLASPSAILAGKPLTVTWTGIPAPSTSDWIGMYKQGEIDERNPTEWNYVQSTGTCTKTNGDGKIGGTCSFPLSTTIPSGIYELRLFSTDSYSKIAVSNLITVTASGSPMPTGSLTPTLTPVPTGPCCSCPTPTPYFQVSKCNGPCMTSMNCPSGQVCLLAENFGWVCRNPACVDTDSCSCSNTSLKSTPTRTPTPTSGLQTIKTNCDDTCTSTSECKSGYQCVFMNNQTTAVCRNPKCFSSQSCVCPSSITTITPTTYTAAKGTEILTPTPTSIAMATSSGTPTPTGLRLDALPTPIPSPTPVPINPPLTIKSFTDRSGKAPQKFTLSGTSDPFTEIDIQFSPDSVGQTTTADAKGAWRYILTKSLSTGNKELTVTARASDGGETQVKQSFTVKSGGSFFSLFVGFLFLALIGGVGFFIYQKQMNDQSSLFSQFPPISSSEGTDASPLSQETPIVSESPSDTEQPPIETENITPEETQEKPEGITTTIPEEKPPFSS